MTSFAPSFKLNLGHTIQPGLVTLGKFNGTDPSLAFATSKDSIIIHSPHSTDNDNDNSTNTRTLAINRRITAITSGSLNTLAAHPVDQLMIGGESSLLCYDVHNNKDLFYQDVKDGCHALTVARGLSQSLGNPSLCVVGGASAVSGVDMLGIESYWTATSDRVTALTAREIAFDSDELLIGTSDAVIRAYQKTNQTLELNEHAAINSLAPLSKSQFAYSLANGTIGVYQGSNRAWMAKSKHTVTAMATFDFDGDGVNEVITGWSHGRLEVRKSDSGALIYKDKYQSHIAALVQGDYRMEGRQAIIACSVDGEVRGYQPFDQNAIVNTSHANSNTNKSATSTDTHTHSHTAPVLDPDMEKSKEKDLYFRKDELLAELQHYELALQRAKEAQSAPPSLQTQSVTATLSSPPSSTQLTVTIKPNKTSQCQLLTVATNNDCVIKLLCVLCEGMFESGESKIIIPSKDKLSSSLSMTLKWTKNLPFVLDIRCIVGHRSATNDAVIECRESLPRFTNFYYCKPRDMQMPQPKSTVTFNTSERVNRLVLWLNSAFILDTNPNVSNGSGPSPLILSVNSDSLTVSFIHLITMTPLIIKYLPDNGGTVTIKSDNMELCGDLIQDFARYCKLTELNSIAEFAEEFQRIEESMEFITEFNNSRIKLSAEMAEATQKIKINLIKAEDARMLELPDLIKTNYQLTYASNEAMLAEYRKRETNQAELFKYLKYINGVIQKGAMLRVGQAKQRLIAGAREAIKNNNSKALIRIIKAGKDKE